MMQLFCEKIQYLHWVFLCQHHEKGLAFKQLDHEVMRWKFGSLNEMLEYKIFILENGSLQQLYTSVNKNNCLNTFPVKIHYFKFVSRRLQTQ